MAIFMVQLGKTRKRGEGLRLGTVRRPPRGVPKSDFARLDYYDVWFPNLSPSAELVKEALGAADSRGWAVFVRKKPGAGRTCGVVASDEFFGWVLLRG
jgi:uncharacterized protein YeaO (DUF488 family)